jgi:DNA-binding NarL/FixJ family response regulator
MLLEMTPDMECTGAYENCNDLQKLLSAHVPDVVLMDIDMPVVNGIEGVKLIREHFPDTCIIMQTVFEDNEQIFESIKSGAHGYILKKAPPEKLLEGIREVMSGGAAMTPSVALKLLQFFKDQQSVKREDFKLSDREVEILGLLVKGLSQKNIANELNLSPFTVNNHLKRIYQKLHVHNASEAVSKAIYKRIV